MKAELTVYGAPWCQPCHQLRAYLDKHRVKYDYVDVDEQPEMMPAGCASVPAVVFADGFLLTAPTPQQVMRRLADD